MELVESTIYNGIEYKVGDYVKIKDPDSSNQYILKIEAIEKETNGITGKECDSALMYSNLCRVINKENNLNFKIKQNVMDPKKFLIYCISNKWLY